MKRFSYRGKFFNKFFVEIDEFQERLDFFDCFGNWLVFDICYFDGIYLDLFFMKDEVKVFNSILFKFIFFRIEVEMVFFEDVQDLFDYFFMFL